MYFINGLDFLLDKIVTVLMTIVVGQKIKMYVSDHMGLQNQVGRSGFYFLLENFCIVPRVRFLFKNNKIVDFRTDFRPILSSRPHNFSQSGPIYFFFL